MIASHPIDLEALVKVELPPLPDVAMRVAALTQNMDSSARAIAEAIGCDPVLGARVLRAANSPLYYLERDVTTLTMAVNAIGNDAVGLVVIASAASDAFRRKGKRSAMETVLWEHALAVGSAGREIMALLGLRGTDQAFISGLLHDIGKLLLLRHDADLYEQLVGRTDERHLLGTEIEVFGYTHAQVGALVAKQWCLPEIICQVIYHHHEPSQAGLATLMARVIEVADGLANRSGTGLWPADDRVLIESDSVIALELSDAQLEGVWERAQSSLSATLALFN
jgi:putative nucleotidyltransferase with HDIG domain